MFFAKVYPFPGGTPQSVAVGKLGPADHPHTQASVKCVAGGPKGQSFFAVDVATTVAGTAADLATKITDVLFGTSKAAGTRGPGRVISRY